LLPYHGLSQKRITLQPTEVNFVIKNAGFNVHGSISGLVGAVTMDAQNSNPAKIEGTINPNTVNTGNSARDKHLKKDEYFDVAEYPKISIASTQIKKVSGDQYTGTFDLTIKGIKKTLEIPFTFSSTATAYNVKGEFTINRLDFKVGGKSMIMSNNVTVKIDLNTTGK
jgi:polyisoprenoid-binding protein YceI